MVTLRPIDKYHLAVVRPHKQINITTRFLRVKTSEEFYF